MTLTLPPVGFFPLLLVCVPAFIHLTLEAKTKTRAFLTAWIFGCGYFIVGFYWISAALFVDIEKLKSVLPFSAIVGPAAFALYWGFIPLFSHRARGNDISYTLSIVAMWAGCEWLRGHLFTGFPWNLPGYAWNYVLPVMQVSSVAGIYGLTLLTLFWAALPVYYRHSKLACFSLVLFIAAGVLGTVRVYMNPTLQNDGHIVRIVQASIPQTMKWAPEEEWRNIDKHVKLTAEDNAKVSFILWPETAVAADLATFADVALYITQGYPENAIGLIGTQRIVKGKDGQAEAYNSVTAITAEGRVADVYDKFHLVPFGEYIPFREQLNLTPVSAAVSNIGDFGEGSGNRTLKFGKLPSVSPLICYEAIFPHAVADQSNRPDWLANVTNDGWYGRTAGPYQHFEITRVRAIEEGLPLARAANTGLSGMVDPVGRIVAKTRLMEERFIDAILPKPLPRTIYSFVGDWFFFGLLFLTIGASRVAWRK